MATSKKREPINEPKPVEGKDQTTPGGGKVSPTMPYYCTWLPGACLPEHQKEAAQTVIPTLPPFCPITLGGAQAQTVIATYPPFCPITAPEANKEAVGTAATVCTMPPACVGHTAFETCPQGPLLSAPPNCPTVQQCPPTWNCGAQAQTILPPTTHPTANTMCYICPPQTATTTVQTTMAEQAQGITGGFCSLIPTLCIATAIAGCGAAAQAQQVTTTVQPSRFICQTIGHTCPITVPQADNSTLATVCTQIGCPQPTTHTQVLCPTATGCPQPTIQTQIGCVHNTLYTLAPPCGIVQTTACTTQIGNTGWETCTAGTGPQVQTVQGTMATVCTQYGCPQPTTHQTGWLNCGQTGTATTTVHPSYICPSHQVTCGQIVTLPPACPMTGPMVCPPSVGCPVQTATTTVQPSYACGGGGAQAQTLFTTIITTVTTGIGPVITRAAGAQAVGDTWNNPACPSRPCPQAQAVTVVSAPPNCGGIYTNACTIGHTGWQTCYGTGPQPALVTAPPNCGGIYTNACPGASAQPTCGGYTGWLNCAHTLATVCTQTCTQTGTGPQLLTAPPNCGGIHTAAGCLLTAPPNCGGIHTNTGCPQPTTYTQPFGHCPINTAATVCTQYGCPQPTIHTQLGCPTMICPVQGGGGAQAQTMTLFGCVVATISAIAHC